MWESRYERMQLECLLRMYFVCVARLAPTAAKARQRTKYVHFQSYRMIGYHVMRTYT